MLYRVAVAYPRRTILAGTLLVLLSGIGIGRLKIQTDGHALVPSARPEVQFDRSVRDDFGVEDQIVVVIESKAADGIFNTETLELVADLTAEFSQIEGLQPQDVLSLATEKNDRVIPGTLTFRAFLDPMPKSDQELKRLRKDLRGMDIYSGTLVSHDERSTAIFLGVRQRVDRTRVYRQIKRALSAYRDRSERIYVVGAPVAEVLLGYHLMDDLGIPASLIGEKVPRGSGIGELLPPKTLYEFRLLVARSIGLLPVGIIVMGLVFLFFFRSFRAILLPLGEVAACLIFVFGLMGWFGVPVYLTIAVMPIILTAVGVADEIHIFHRYREHLQRQPKDAHHVELVEMTMAEMWRPILKTSITTAIAFLSFTLSPIGPVRVFGMFTALGVLFCLLWSLTVIPASLVITRPESFARRGGRGPVDRGQRSFLEVFARFQVSEIFSKERIFIPSLKFT